MRDSPPTEWAADASGRSLDGRAVIAAFDERAPDYGVLASQRCRRPSSGLGFEPLVEIGADTRLHLGQAVIPEVPAVVDQFIVDDDALLRP